MQEVDPEDLQLPDDVPDPDWDPAPAWQTEANDAPVSPSSSEKAALALKTEVSSWIALAYSIPVDTLATIDPFCFGALQEPETAHNVVDALSDIVMGSPRVAEWIGSHMGLAPYIKLGVALKPVIINGWRHHVTHSVQVEVDRENMTYAVQQRDYSQYPAA